MGHSRRQVPPTLKQAVIDWADASADLAAVLRQINYDETPHLRLVTGPHAHRRSSPWRGRFYRAAAFPLFIFPLLHLHPGLIKP